MLSPPAAVRRGPLLFAVLGQGLSTGLGFAGLGLALYAQGPAWPAAALFGAVGGVCGLVSAVVRLVREGEPAPLPVPLPPDEMARLVRATVAAAQLQRQASRGGSAADRRPAPQAGPAAARSSAAPPQPPDTAAAPLGAPALPVAAPAERRRAARTVEA